jgi:hypothetical protein
MAVAHVVRIETGAADTMELLSVPYMWSGEVRGGQVALVGPTTMLFHDDGNAAFLYREGDGDVLKLDYTDWRVSLAGRAVGLNLGEDSAAAWLAEASEDELARLRYVSVPNESPAALRPALARLAAANPGVGLRLGSVDEMMRTLPLFRPRMLWLDYTRDSTALLSATQESLARLIAAQPQIEQLSLPAMDSGPASALGSLPLLRHLTLNELDPDQVSQIPVGLETLAIYDQDDDVDVTKLASVRRLRTLDLSFATWTGGSDLAALTRLRWIAFPVNISQADFDAILAAHPDLEVFALMTDSVIDLWPLRHLRHLRAVTLLGEFRNLRVLRELPSLEFVGLSTKFWEDYPEQALAIQEALPKAAVVKVTPICLGSGWILLLVPIMLLVLAVPRRRVA